MNNNFENRLAFIVGHYKSGSTWLTHLLSLYPGIRGVREAHVFRYVQTHDTLKEATKELFGESAWAAGGLKKFPRFWLGNLTRGIRTKTGLARGTATLSASEVPSSMHDLGLLGQQILRNRLNSSQNGDEYCRQFFSFLVDHLKPKAYLIEKTPTNIFYIEDIRRIFPRAKFISIHRDGRDVVVSDKHHLKRAYNTSESFENRVLKWKEAMETELDKANTFGIHQLSYEQLKNEPVATTEALLDFLELKYDRDLVNQMISGSSFEAMSGGRSAGVENRQTFFRKGIVGDWRNSLSDEEVSQFSEIAGDLLVKLGYESSPEWQNWC